MLLSLRSRLAVSLYPTHITLVRVGRGWLPQAAQPETVMLEPIPDQPEWQAPLDALAAWLKQPGHGAGELHCVLADRFVRYALIPWTDDVQKPAELEVFARINFETVLGAANNDWLIKVDRSEYGQPAVASAVDRRLMEALQAIAKASKTRLSAIQPHFMQVFNHVRQRINGDVLFAVLDAGQCIVATIKNDTWHSLRALKIERADPESHLQKLIGRERLLQGLNEQVKTYVYSSETLDASKLGPQITILKDDVPLAFSGTRQNSVMAGVQ